MLQDKKFFKLIVTREVAAEYHGVKKIPLLPFQEQRKKLYECAIGLTKIDAGDMLCIGDSVGELEPAKKLGIKTIGVLTGFSSKEDMEKASISTKILSRHHSSCQDFGLLKKYSLLNRKKGVCGRHLHSMWVQFPSSAPK